MWKGIVFAKNFPFSPTIRYVLSIFISWFWHYVLTRYIYMYQWNLCFTCFFVRGLLFGTPHSKMIWGQFGNQTPHSKFQSGAMYIYISYTYHGYIYVYMIYISCIYIFIFISYIIYISYIYHIYISYIYIIYIYISTLSLQVANLAMARELGLVGWDCNHLVFFGMKKIDTKIWGFP